MDIGAASTDILVDAPAPFTDVSNNIVPLVTRAGVFSRFITSGAVTEVISRETGIPSSEIATSTPISGAAEAADPGSEERARAVIDEGKQYRVQVVPSNQLPLFTIFTQAPTATAALRLADGAAAAVVQVADQSQKAAGTPPERRVQVRQIGAARGGTVNEGVNKVLAVIVFIGLMIVACLLILAMSSFRRAWRGLDAMEEGTSGNGNATPRLPDGHAAALPEMSGQGRQSHFADIVANRVESIIWNAEVAAARIKAQAEADAARTRHNGEVSEQASKELTQARGKLALPARGTNTSAGRETDS